MVIHKVKLLNVIIIFSEAPATATETAEAVVAAVNEEVKAITEEAKEATKDEKARVRSVHTLTQSLTDLDP